MPDVVFTLAFLFFAFLFILFWMILKRKTKNTFSAVDEQLRPFEKRQAHLEHVVKDEIARNREETANSDKRTREELSQSLRGSSDSLLMRLTEHFGMYKNQLDSFSKQLGEMTKLNQEKLEQMRNTVERQLRVLQEENSKKLEQMRSTVDEKLQTTLEKRLGESFKQVSERLEQVYKGLGEMRSLASGVGDLKKVLTNVKTRGTWGEIRLGNILEQILTPEQYEVNVAIKKNSSDRVEFAIKLPGQNVDKDTIVWMPIDSKFPQEDYQRLIDAQEAADKEQAEKSIKSLETRIKLEAKEIKEKYIDPPYTTDFGIMFLPVEGLYAEVLRRPGLCDTLQREYRVVVTGPTTLAALLNSLQMGFRTLAIEKRSSEVWELLGAVKTQFGQFGDALSKTKKKLQEASNSIDSAEIRTRAIERKLRDVQEIPEKDPVELIEKD
ncbi:MAG: DNA recombination protein RmuC [Desulfobacterales bacterium]|jgi:DNA recombination protein RmuC|nr:DNA recombination protein RmuC [Desulfobacterales bacterium]MDP6682424.1 DNA recombination protein RmuC [Desulfobacterales bacterium]MDP6807174.1 DNA recombination protein RmuC [Desulfobacterales bacterium]|tara:strand:+ start:17814 stop:19127 length:1314 start_codon:yes stop_codon:yes gene_type:complete